MKIGLLLLLLTLLLSTFSPPVSVFRNIGANGRFVSVRKLPAVPLASIAVIAAFVFLPGHVRLLLFLPAFLASTLLLKLWRTRATLRSRGPERVDIEKMKRVNRPAAL